MAGRRLGPGISLIVQTLVAGVYLWLFWILTLDQGHAWGWLLLLGVGLHLTIAAMRLRRMLSD
jgi:hypothetical protein